jgi:hypothetical protein
MKSRLVRSLGFFALVVVVLLAALVLRASRPHEVTVAIEAAEGTKLSGTYRVDGELSHFDSEAPTSFIVAIAKRAGF